MYFTGVYDRVFLAGKPEGTRAFLSCELLEPMGQK
jgi:hypothetical protein